MPDPSFAAKRTSQSSDKAKFTGIAHLLHRPGPEGLPRSGHNTCR
jgi:hypothetical protein